MQDEGSDQSRTLGLLAATGVGVGAIVGGGIFVLAGVAYAAAGPSAMIAFGINAGVAFLTAMSFAEISSAFPESGGAYTFAKKVLSVRAAFAAGWILWFAYIVAGVLYALGFASFAALTLQAIWDAAGSTPPDWFFGRRLMLLFASGATIAYAISLVRSSAGGGQWATVGKVVVFAGLIMAGLIALLRQDFSQTTDAVSPFFSGGASGLLMAMGFTFIALQGFDLIAAVASEVKDPGRTIPRAMFLSLGCAVIIYLPLLFLVSAVGVEPGESISKLASAQPENVIPIAVKRFMGPVGYWLVLVAALLSTLSALQANLLAASRVALSMARDRTLPGVLGDVHAERRTPVMAIYTTTLTLIAIVFMVPNLAAAGAAASLIFLISFTLAHVTTYLARRRGGTINAPYRTPWFPAIPVAGGLACAGLGVFQALAVPDAGGIVVIWLGLGVVLYWSLFARRAELVDAASEALDPSLVTLRGHSPLVLVPIANPAHAPGMVSVANALAARKVGRVLLLSIVPIADDHELGTVPEQFESTKRVIDEALRLSYSSGFVPEALITAASAPLAEIRRIAEEHPCGSLLLGIGDISADAGSPAIEKLMNDIDADVALMKSSPGWSLDDAKRLLVPLGGRGEQDELRARLVGSICRAAAREVTFITVLPSTATDRDVASVQRAVRGLADLKVRGATDVQIVKSNDAAATLIERAADYDLMVLGLKAAGWRKKVIGPFALRIAREAPCATIFLSRRRPGVFELLEPLRDDVVDSIRDAVKNSPMRNPKR